jgi:hypothetical protein
MSKSLDMRFHWLRDRIDQGQLRVVFVPGLRNLADLFTKSLPVARHRVISPFIACDEYNIDVDTVNLLLRYCTTRIKNGCVSVKLENTVGSEMKVEKCSLIKVRDRQRDGSGEDP